MKRIFALALFLFLIVAVVLADGPKSEPAVISPSAEKRLSWENHRLRATNIALQIEQLKREQAEQEKAADAELAEMQKAVGEKYLPRIGANGQLEFALKEAKSEVKK
jgi:hypothetical protein